MGSGIGGIQGEKFGIIPENVRSQRNILFERMVIHKSRGGLANLINNEQSARSLLCLRIILIVSKWSSSFQIALGDVWRSCLLFEWLFFPILRTIFGRVPCARVWLRDGLYPQCKNTFHRTTICSGWRFKSARSRSTPAWSGQFLVWKLIVIRYTIVRGNSFLNRRLSPATVMTREFLRYQTESVRLIKLLCQWYHKKYIRTNALISGCRKFIPKCQKPIISHKIFKKWYKFFFRTMELGKVRKQRKKIKL